MLSRLTQMFKSAPSDPAAPEHIARLEACLDALVDANTGHTYRSSRALRPLKTDGSSVTVEVVLAYPAQSCFDAIRQQVSEALAGELGDLRLEVSVSSQIGSHAVQRGVPLLPGVKNIIAVASGKGGVGKSTTSVNLALALASEGARVGILDADIYGPSLPLMLGMQGQRPASPDGKSILPIENHGIQTMSMGYMVDDDQAMVWRGPMVTQALMQLLNDTRWDNLDYLVIDLPPGTGDVQLTLAQKIPVTGAVIVTTPQDIALIDARKGLTMFEKVGVPVLGIVENMAMHVCSQCGHVEAIFGSGGGARMAEQYQVELIGQLPLDLAIRQSMDEGRPTLVSAPDSPAAGLYRQIARKVAVKVGEKARDYSSRLPKIVVQNT